MARGFSFFSFSRRNFRRKRNHFLYTSKTLESCDLRSPRKRGGMLLFQNRQSPCQRYSERHRELYLLDYSWRAQRFCSRWHVGARVHPESTCRWNNTVKARSCRLVCQGPTVSARSCVPVPKGGKMNIVSTRRCKAQYLLELEYPQAALKWLRRRESQMFAVNELESKRRKTGSFVSV